MAGGAIQPQPEATNCLGLTKVRVAEVSYNNADADKVNVMDYSTAADSNDLSNGGSGAPLKNKL